MPGGGASLSRVDSARVFKSKPKKRLVLATRMEVSSPYAQTTLGLVSAASCCKDCNWEGVSCCITGPTTGERFWYSRPETLACSSWGSRALKSAELVSEFPPLWML